MAAVLPHDCARYRRMTMIVERSQVTERKSYEPPRIDIYNARQIMELFGPAVAIYGMMPGTT